MAKALEFPLFIEFDVDGDNTGVLLFSSNDNGVFIDSGNPIRIGVKATGTAIEWLGCDHSRVIYKDRLFKNPKTDKYPNKPIKVCSRCGKQI